MLCKNCGNKLTLGACLRCGTGGMSEPDGKLDSLVQRASAPSLATLFKRAKQAGAIGAVTVYGEGQPS